MKHIMKLTVITSLFLFMAGTLFAQNTEGVVRVRTREDILRKLPVDVAYFMPSFKEGTLIYTNGSKSTGKLNICLVDNSVRFVNDSGDTLLMANAANVSRVLFGDTLLLHTKDCFVKQIAICGSKSISLRKQFKFESPETGAGYAGVPKTSTATTASAREMGGIFAFEYDVEIPYELKTDYVLTDKDKIYSAKLSSFTRLFPEKKKEIKQFVKERRIKFYDKNDLVALLMFCSDML